MTITRRFFTGLLAALLSLPLAAQEATLQTPETVSGTKVKLAYYNAERSTMSITVGVTIETADGTVVRTIVYTATNAEALSLVTAADTVRAGGETGNAFRKFQYRVLGWMADNSKITNASGTPITVTVAP